MVWRLVNSLDRLRAQVRAAAPRAVPPATAASAWGTIGDTAHTSTSDHSPHTYSVLGPTPVVCAADFPHAPTLGLDFGVFAEALRRSRDPRIGYVIFAGRVFSGHPVGSVPAYTWRDYDGSDQHYTHGHVSTVHTAAADDTRDWAMPGTAGATGDDVNLNDKLGQPLFVGDDGLPPTAPTGLTVGQAIAYAQQNSHYARKFAEQTRDEVRELVEKLGTPVDGEVLEAQPIDLDALAAKVLEGLGDQLVNKIVEQLGALRFEATGPAA